MRKKSAALLALTLSLTGCSAPIDEFTENPDAIIESSIYYNSSFFAITNSSLIQSSNLIEFQFDYANKEYSKIFVKNYPNLKAYIDNSKADIKLSPFVASEPDESSVMKTNALYCVVSIFPDAGFDYNHLLHLYSEYEMPEDLFALAKIAGLYPSVKLKDCIFENKYDNLIKIDTLPSKVMYNNKEITYDFLENEVNQ